MNRVLRKIGIAGGIVSFLFGIMVINLFGLGTITEAANQTIKSVLIKKVVVDGKPTIVANKNAVMTRSGSIYLPLATVSSLMGKTVTWDAKNGTLVVKRNVAKTVTKQTTVNLPKKIYPHSPDGVDLTSLDYLSTDNVDVLRFNRWGDKDDQSFIMGGKTYAKGIGFDVTYNSPYIAYNLDSSYTKLTGYFGYADKWNQNRPIKLIIYGDKKKLFESQEAFSGGIPQSIDVDITGINQLVLKFENGTSYTMRSILADPKLY